MVAAAMCLAALQSPAQGTVAGVRVEGVRCAREGGRVVASMSLDLSGLKVRGNRAVLMTPCLRGGGRELHLRAVGAYGRGRLLRRLRAGGAMGMSGAGELSFPCGRIPGTVCYSDTVPYEEWMDGARLLLHRSLHGCCDRVLERVTVPIGGCEAFTPELLFARPVAPPMERTLQGSARIEFPVNSTSIDPAYGNNPAEFSRLAATLDSIRSGPDVCVTGVRLKGYASPESPYAHNGDLARGRVEALRDHVLGLCGLDDGLVDTEYEPEDWEGLRAYVEGSALEHRTEILELIDSDMDPDAKEARLRREYPKEYRLLLGNCYPALRRTEYLVTYTIGGRCDLDEARRVLATEPDRLGLDELHLLAGSLEDGSPELGLVVRTAVRLFPMDPVANLNAANLAIGDGDLGAAAGYLAKAGDSGEAEYARGVLAWMEGRASDAAAHFGRALGAGISQAGALLSRLAR